MQNNINLSQNLTTEMLGYLGYHTCLSEMHCFILNRKYKQATQKIWSNRFKDIQGKMDHHDWTMQWVNDRNAIIEKNFPPKAPTFDDSNWDSDFFNQ
jgi:hypothetical protein